jgi:hypothetical protein
MYFISLFFLKCSITWATLPHFTSFIFHLEKWVFQFLLKFVSDLYAFHVSEITVMLHMHCLVEMCSSWLCLGCPESVILLISASLGAVTTRVNCHAQVILSYLYFPLLYNSSFGCQFGECVVMVCSLSPQEFYAFFPIILYFTLLLSSTFPGSNNISTLSMLCYKGRYFSPQAFKYSSLSCCTNQSGTWMCRSNDLNLEISHHLMIASVRSSGSI